MEFTREQKRAITARDHNILVSAAAGSGKTRVLTERIISRLKDGENIDELLVVTFTRAAAGEMKERIRKRIMEESAKAEGEERARWQKQLTLLGDAPISTIHSFCLRLLRRHYNLLPGLDPKFKLTDPKRAEILRSDLLASYIEECYIETDEAKRQRFFDLLRLYGSRLNDNGLQKEILGLMDFGSSQGDPEEWLKMACDRFGDLDFWYETALSEGRAEIQRLIDESEHDLALMKKIGGSEGCIYTLESDIAQLSELLNADWDSLTNASPFIKKKSKRKEDDPDIDAFMKARRDNRKKYFSSVVLMLFARPFKTYAGEIADLMPKMETLAEMTAEFTRRYRTEKLKRSALDFGDLELFALRLLTDNPSLAAEYQNYFKEILVDEYQDTNPLQERILLLLAGKGKLFTVGDIKQSIYGFRLADPSLFRARAHAYQAEEPNENGLLIYLNRNFRSRGEVLSVTNRVFSSLMNESVTGLSYGLEEQLEFGADYYEDRPDTQAELVIIDIPKDDESDDYGTMACHGRFIADRIERMIAEGQTVQKREGIVPMCYGDITILLRSGGDKAEAIGAELTARGIPVQTPSNVGFLSGRETKLLCAILSVLDNPLQDIPLAAVMRSPFFGFDENELLILSLQRKGKKLWEHVLSVEKLEREGLPVEKVVAFREKIAEWRQYGKIYPVGDLVDMLLKEFDYAAFWGGLPGGRRRIRNIRLFAEEAYRFQQEDGGGLFDFLRFLDHLAESGGDEIEAEEGEENHVRIMTVHKSKGLEFPVVFLVNTEKPFNKEDLKAPLIIDKELGFGPLYKDEKRRVISRSLPQILIRRRKDRENLAEEMRVLYVAMTRAREKLIITASDKATNNASVEEKFHEKANDVYYDDEFMLPATLLLSDTSYFGWLKHTLAEHRGIPWENEDDFSVTVKEALSAEECGEPVIPNRESAVSRLLTEKDMARLKAFLCRESVRPLPAKVSVTSLLPKGAWETDEVTLPRPRFMEQRPRLTAAEKGTAFHLFMEKVALDRDWNEDEIREFISELRDKRVLTPLAAESLNVSSILSFLHSSYGREMREAEEIRRELSFVGGFPAEELFDDASGDRRTVMLQGAIDLIYRRPDGSWVLLDYKTNDLRNYPAVDFLNKYGRQMELYSAALKKIYDIDVAERVFFLTKTGEFIGY